MSASFQPAALPLTGPHSGESLCGLSGAALRMCTRRNPRTLTDAADLLSVVQAAPLVRDGFQHLLQGPVQLSVLLLRGPDSLTQTGEGRHLRAGIMTVRANSFRRHRFTAEAAQDEDPPRLFLCFTRNNTLSAPLRNRRRSRPASSAEVAEKRAGRSDC